LPPRSRIFPPAYIKSPKSTWEAKFNRDSKARFVTASNLSQRKGGEVNLERKTLGGSEKVRKDLSIWSVFSEKKKFHKKTNIKAKEGSLC